MEQTHKSYSIYQYYYEATHIVRYTHNGYTTQIILSCEMSHRIIVYLNQQPPSVIRPSRTGRSAELHSPHSPGILRTV